MLDLDVHPTADQVYDIVIQRMSNISRTTVYRTLETLAAMGLVNKTSHPGSVVRYDNRIEVHHHLICQSCGDIVDISDKRLDELELPDTSSVGFKVLDYQVQLRGICKSCREKEGEL
jgi:Fur family peroxide stress response transcriptional regulator